MDNCMVVDISVDLVDLAIVVAIVSYLICIFFQPVVTNETWAEYLAKTIIN